MHRCDNSADHSFRNKRTFDRNLCSYSIHSAVIRVGLVLQISHSVYRTGLFAGQLAIFRVEFMNICSNVSSRNYSIIHVLVSGTQVEVV